MNRKETFSGKLPSIIAASTAGTLIEWYDFFIFGSLATIISTEYFPNDSPTASFLATLATFSAGLLIRPLGALIFGRLGDLVGRKPTFMITLALMGVSTVGMGLAPGYASIGLLAPVTVLVLRLIQGLALGGEYGGAVTYVAEHSPVNRRGFLTSWLQSTSGLAFILSITVVLFIKGMMSEEAWHQWGWRLPFIASAFLVFVSYYIRHRMTESPLFTEAKKEGKIAHNPIRETFGKKENLKIVLVAFLGLTLGGGAIGWITFYALGFLLKTVMIDFDQANQIIIVGILAGMPFFILFGWLSDKIGRKWLLMVGLLAGALSFKPIFQGMYHIGNSVIQPAEITDTIVRRETNTVDNNIHIKTTTTEYFYSNGAIKTETRKAFLDSPNPHEETVFSIRIPRNEKVKLIFLVFCLQFIFTLAYGPLGAYMVEMFPLRIRYTSVSFPYHFGVGIFGGLAPYFSTYLVGKAEAAGDTGFFLAGLIYPVFLTTISFVIGVIYLKDTRRKSVMINSSLLQKANFLRKWLGLIWIALAALTCWFGIIEIGLPRILSGVQEDIVFGAIVTGIITPVLVAGLFIFGKYSLQGEYSK